MPVTLRQGIEIRSATPLDAPGLTALLGMAGQACDARRLAERLLAMRLGGTALLALQWGPPSGLVVLHWYAGLDEDRPVAQITTLLVAPEERRRGIGRLLIKAAAQAARVAGCGRLELLDTAAAPSIRAFCQANGFAEAGIRYCRSLHKQR